METLQIKVLDGLSPAIEHALKTNHNFMRRALKAVGFEARKEIIAGIKSGRPGGHKFAPKYDYDTRKKLQKGYAASPTNWYGKMKKAVMYQYENNGVNLGWASYVGVAYGRKQEEGFKIPVTAGVMKKWASIGHPLSNSTRPLEVPARPVFEPMAAVLADTVADIVEQKVQGYIDGTIELGKRKRRKYKVY